MNLLININLGWDGITGEFYQTYKELLLISNCSKKTEEKGTLANLFYKASLSWYQNQTQMPQEKKITGKYLWWT